MDHTAERPAAGKRWRSTMGRFTVTVIFCLLFESLIIPQTLSERAREMRKMPGTPVVVTMVSELAPLSLGELAEKSDIVVEATVSRLKSYVNEADTAVLTDDAIHPIRVLIGTLPAAPKTPGVAVPFI